MSIDVLSAEGGTACSLLTLTQECGGPGFSPRYRLIHSGSDDGLKW